MASCITAQYGSVLKYCPQAKLTVTQSSSTGSTATLSWTLQYVAHGYAAYTNGSGRSYTVKINGTTVKTGSYNINGLTGTYTMASGSTTVNKSTAAKSVSFSVTFGINLTWGSTHKDSVSASGSISVAAKTSYTIKYNANGGSGAPSSQTKWYGTTLKLSTTKPTRTGYSFSGWATSASGSVAYAAGANYTANAAATLYAVWKANTYSVKFDANGGSGAPAAQTKTYGVTLKLSATKPTRTNYNFLGWGTSASSTTIAYAAGANYTANAAATLYAVWELAHVAPTIDNVSIGRCNSSGTLLEEGTYVKVVFDWTSETTDTKTFTIGYKLSTATTYTNTTFTATTASGTVSRVIGSGSISTDYEYDVMISIADTYLTTTYGGVVADLNYIIDFKRGGKGMSIGKPCLEEGLEVDWSTQFNGDILSKYTDYDGEKLNSFLNIKPLPVGTNLNDLKEPGVYYSMSGLGDYASTGGITSVTSDGVSSFLMNATFRLEVTKGGYREGYPENFNQTIEWIDKNNYSIYQRAYYDGSWGGWQTALRSGLRVLWSGVHYMSDTQTITLKQPVTGQHNGIVLIFSSYDPSTSTYHDYNFQSTFIPKGQVVYHEGSGFLSIMATSNSPGSFWFKYLYINNKTIVGHSANKSSGTSGSGVKYDNRYGVLRTVYGV